MGFAVVRILGNDMDPNNLVKFMPVLQQGDFEDVQVKQMMEFFK